MLQEPNYISEISQTLTLKTSGIEIVLDLISEGATVPFIARYRREKTGGLDENHIRDIIELRAKIENLFKAKTTAINGITELGAMTDELMNNILRATTIKQVEEIYKPYKAKKKTKAMLAIEKGFQVVADEIKKNISGDLERNENIRSLQKEYSLEEIIEGSQHIIAAEISANSDLRTDLIDALESHGTIASKLKGEKMLAKLNDKDTGQIQKFDIYKEFSGRLGYLKPYQILALNRGENLGILGVKIDKTEKLLDGVTLHYARLLNIRTPFIEVLGEAFTDGYNTLFKSVENEVRGMLSVLGEDDAIDTFRSNLGQLLMTKPEYGNTILAIDPGFYAGCKIAVLDTLGNPIHFNKVFLRAPDQALVTLKQILQKYPIDIIVVGNGTGSNETIELLQQITKLEIFIVNESGASVYSASKIAQEEFPDLDSLDRGTVSIGRRYIDPLSELVKIPVGSIGVGMYQHDIPEKKLEEKLGFVVEDTVNEVGINVNTASSYVLGHISGITKAAAKKIYNNRPYSSRKNLKKQLTPKAYEQAIGFLRVPESKEPLDNTDIHPEQYELAKYIQEHQIKTIEELQKLHPSQPSLILGKGQEYFISPGNEGEMPEGQRGLLVTQNTISFILESLESAGVEKRVNSTHKKATIRGAVSHSEGDVVDGVIRNVVAFGAFVDIGMKNDGLVHVSQIADKFVSDPREEVQVGQTVKVKITGIDEKTGKIQLSMKNI